MNIFKYFKIIKSESDIKKYKKYGNSINHKNVSEEYYRISNIIDSLEKLVFLWKNDIEIEQNKRFLFEKSEIIAKRLKKR